MATFKYAVMAALLAAGVAHAAEDAGKVVAERLFPGAKTKKVSGGLIEVESKIFVSQDGKAVLIGGRSVDPAVLTGGAPGMAAAPGLPQAQPQAPQPQKADFSKLPLDKAVKIVKGSGRRVVAIFTDVDCPFCKRLEETIAQLDDVTVYNFMMPIAQLHPDARRKSEAIWCAEDRAQAWGDFWASGRVPDVAKCATPIDEIAGLANSLNIRGTPTLVRATDGAVLPGAVPKEMLDGWLSGK